ncbi:MAG TPA: hypothetical protein VNA20_04955 [Frankiaceae bacterium]|nr:hypothetical protein [Frankiaceae bacterium]
MRLVPALVRLVAACALVASFAPAPALAGAAEVDPFGLTTTSPKVEANATEQLHAAADAMRVNAGNDPLYRREVYASAATRIATALVNGETFAPPPDDAPYTYLSGSTYDYGYADSIASAIAGTVGSARAVLRYPMQTDGGWSVVTSRRLDGQIRYGIALVVGWPAPAVSKSRGCSAGYCWSNSGLHPHLPWTRNTVRWYLSTSNLPAGGEQLVKTAIKKLNAVPGFGAHLVYGGRTTATAPTSTRRFVLVFGSGCSTANALGCTITTTQGAFRQIFQAKSIITLSRYRANPSPTWWIGTLMHEIAHGVGLGHYDSAYNGSYQLMRSSGGPDELHLGDRNGLRRVAPPGRIAASVVPRRVGTVHALAVRTSNSGLGGIRAIRTQCTDGTGTWRNVALVTGNFDGRLTERVVGSFAPPNGTTRGCRAIVRSKSSVLTTPSVAVYG